MRTKLEKLEGYIGIPHELLHVAGYRLVGKRCYYRWGEPFVTPVTPLTRREQVVGLLFPFCVFSLVFLLLALLSGLILASYAETAAGPPAWVSLLAGLALLSGIYACLSVGDLRQAYLLIRQSPANRATPFDFLWTWQSELRQVDTRLIVVLIVFVAVLLFLSWPT